MAGNDLKLNKLSFDTNAFMAIFKNICNLYLDDLSQKLKNLVMGEIWLSGNGSSAMKLTAVAAVKETKREITNDHILLEVGIDLEDLKGKAEALFVRVYVVLHGNQSGGPLHEKPGIATWNKHILIKRLPDPDTRNADNDLPDEFNQTEKAEDIVRLVAENVEKDANKYIKIFIDGIKGALASINLAAFVNVG